MAVKKGYKQTEAGLIPDDWEVHSLGNVCTFLDGKRRPVKDVDRARMKGDVPYYGASGVVDYVNSFLFDEELILLGEDGENIVSRNTRLAFRISGKSWVNNHAHVIRPNANVSLGYLCETLEAINYEQYNSGSAQPKLNRQTCNRIPIPLPPTLTEQEAIAGALSDADAWIESLEQLIAKKRQIKQGAMQELLTGKRRLPGFSEPWCTRAISKLLKYHRLGGNYSNMEAETNYPLIKMGNLDRGAFNMNKVEYVSHNITPDQQDRLKRGDILFNTRNTLDLVGKVAIWRDELPVAYYNSNLLRLDFDSVIVGSHFFMNLALNSEDVIRQLRERATGTTSVAAIYTRDLLNVEVRLPTNCDEQIAIAEVIEDMNGEIDSLESKLAKAREIKQGMMQELLTGRIRLA